MKLGTGQVGITLFRGSASLRGVRGGYHRQLVMVREGVIEDEEAVIEGGIEERPTTDSIQAKNNRGGRSNKDQEGPDTLVGANLD